MVMDPPTAYRSWATNLSVNGLKRGVSDTGGMVPP